MFITTFEAFYREAMPQLALLESFFGKHQLVGLAKIDHIGYKCASSREFEELRRVLEEKSVFIFQSLVSGRRIAIVKLRTGFETSLGSCTYLELSDQKRNMSQVSGFDHAEIYPTGHAYDDLVAYLAGRGDVPRRAQKPHHTTDDIDIDVNFTLKLSLEPLIEKIKREEMVR